MSNNILDPLIALQISKSPLITTQKFTLTEQFFDHISEATRIVSAAQVEYDQAKTRTSSVLFGVFLQPSTVPSSKAGPSATAKKPDFA